MPALLEHRWSELLRERPKLRLREAARELNVSEAELLATDCGAGVTRLRSEWPELLRELPKLGRVLCVTKNDVFVHERFGQFRGIEFFADIGVVLGEDIDLRLFMQNWRYGFAVLEKTAKEERRSFQFFDASGTEIHRINLQKDSSTAAYEALVEQFASPDQSAIETAFLAPVVELPDHEIDVEGFQREWLALEDTVHFADILKKYRIRREQGLRLAPAGHARQVARNSIRTILEAVAEIGLPVMIFVRTSGCIQIHSGIVSKVKMFGQDWLNILDSDFNLHVRLPLVHSVWVVRKPTIDGEITSLEVFDSNGENVALFFGKRGYGKSERLSWRYLLAEQV